MNGSPNEFANDPEAASVLHFIQAGLWRKARDAAKDLCKKDRSKYLDLLIRANVGLVREMLGKDLVKEAKTVFAYLETFAPADILTMLRAEMAAPTGKLQAAALADSGGAGWWLAALRADEVLMKAGSVSPADQAAVDLLVTDAFEPDGLEDNERAACLAAELRAVRNASSATGDGRWEDAKNALRGLPRQSVFWQWRIFLRGVRCAFEEERETARQCFAQLPQTGTLARAAAALAPDLAVSARPAPASATVPLYLAATGQPATWAAPVLTASTSWKAGKRLQAFDDLVTGMKGAFPSVMPGLPALLTDAILPSYARMKEGDWVDSEDLYSRFTSGRVKHGSLLPKTTLAFLRSMCVAENREMPHEELDKSWRMLIQLWEDCHGADPQRDSLAWQWLGKILENPDSSNSDPFDDNGTVTAESATKAIHAYEKAIKADDSNQDAWLGLVTLLIRQRDTKRSNKMLDELVKKFPRNKGFLILAGDRAIARKSYAKGCGFLQSALALDPLDKNLKEQIAIALTLRVRDAYRKGEPTAALWAEMEPLLENNPQSAPYMLSRWMARVRRSLLDKAPEVAALAEAEAIALAPSNLIRVFFGIILASVYGIPPRKDWQSAWLAVRSSPDNTWKSLLDILRILDFTTAISGWGWKQTNQACDRVLELVKHLVAPTQLQVDPVGLIGSLDELAAFKKHAAEPAKHAIGYVLRDVSDALDRYVKPGSKKAHPGLRLANLLLNQSSYQSALKHLKIIIADAEATGFSAVAERARIYQKNIESRCHISPLDIPDDEEEDIWDDEDEDDAIAEGMMTAERYMAELAAAVADGDDAAVKQIRKTLIGLGIDKHQIDITIRLLTATRKLATAEKTKKVKKTDDDPRQINLF